MKNNCVLSIVAMLSIIAGLMGCANNEGVVRLNENQIIQQEVIADQARNKIHTGDLDGVTGLLKPLRAEKTTSQPLYNCELGTYYLLCNNKEEAKKYLSEAYNSIEEFYPSTEKKAVSLWGAESNKVFKGDPYEQATLALLVGMLYLEEGDVDNALACFKTGQLADSDVKEEKYKCDYGLLQFLESKCHSFRNDSNDDIQRFLKMSYESFITSHPCFIIEKNKMLTEYFSKRETKEMTEAERSQLLESRTDALKQEFSKIHLSYCQPMDQKMNTLLLIWSGRSPVFQRGGQYGEIRYMLKSSVLEKHFEVLIDGSNWCDSLHGFANITYQASTRGGRMMDNVLANQAAFKSSAANIGNAFFDAADDVSDPYAALALLVIGGISHGVGAAANAKADIRCWQSLPYELVVVPAYLTPGTHSVKIDCYDDNLNINRNFEYNIDIKDKPFQFYSMHIPSIVPPLVKKKVEDKGLVSNDMLSAKDSI